MSEIEFGGMGALPTGVGSWKSFWRKFKKVFKAAAKKAATSDQVKDALNSQYPGAGDAAQKGMQLIDSAASGNKTALAQVKGIADAAKAGDTNAQPAHDLLSTLNDARKEAKTETTAQVGGGGGGGFHGHGGGFPPGVMIPYDGMYSPYPYPGADPWMFEEMSQYGAGASGLSAIYNLLGKHLKITEGGKTVLCKVVRVLPEPAIEIEALTVVPGKKVWIDLEKLGEGIKEKAVVWTDEKGTPVNVGWHHGGHGFRTFDPRDMYWGPRIDVDDDGQPILVGGGGGGHHHGGRRGWGGFGAPYWGGMWYPPMWEEVEIVTEEEVPDEQLRPKRVIVKKEAK